MRALLVAALLLVTAPTASAEDLSGCVTVNPPSYSASGCSFVVCESVGGHASACGGMQQGTMIVIVCVHSECVTVTSMLVLFPGGKPPLP